MALSTPMRLCSHHHASVPELLYHLLKGNLYSLSTPPHSPLPPALGTQGNLFSISVDSCIPDILRNRFT